MTPFFVNDLIYVREVDFQIGKYLAENQLSANLFSQDDIKQSYICVSWDRSQDFWQHHATFSIPTPIEASKIDRFDGATVENLIVLNLEPRKISHAMLLLSGLCAAAPQALHQ